MSRRIEYSNGHVVENAVEGTVRDQEPSVLGILLALAATVAMVAWIAMANPTPDERANMFDKLPTKSTHSTGVNWK